MKKKFRFYLTTLPCIGAFIFFLFNILAIYSYPGYDKCAFFESDACKSTQYSFKYNFFSELGSIKTNTDDDNLPKKEIGQQLVGIIDKEGEKKIPFYNETIKPITDKLSSYISKSEGGDNNESNLISMLLFNSSLIIVGLTLILFYKYYFHK